MKLNLLIISVILMSISVFGQRFGKLEDVKFETIEDYDKYDKELKETTEYILNKPLDKDDIDRAYAIRFVYKWMEGAPYTFMINEEVVDLTQSNEELMTVYLASMVNYAINNIENVKDQKIVRKESLIIFLTYIDNPKYLVEQTRLMKKYVKAMKKNELDKLLK